jgi:hypothetical protein
MDFPDNTSLYPAVNNMINSYPISSLAKNTILEWFTNKVSSKPKITEIIEVEGKGKEIQGKAVSLPAIIDAFLNDIITQIWTNLRTLGVEGLKGLKRSPPVIKFGVLSGVLGLYSPVEHEIYLNAGDYDIKATASALQKYKDLYSKDPVKAGEFYRENEHIVMLTGTKVSPPTFIHETGHALKSGSHNDGNAHGAFIFTIKGRNTEYFYNKGCNELWRMGIEKYVPKY